MLLFLFFFNLRDGLLLNFWDLDKRGPDIDESLLGTADQSRLLHETSLYFPYALLVLELRQVVLRWLLNLRSIPPRRKQWRQVHSQVLSVRVGLLKHLPRRTTAVQLLSDLALAQAVILSHLDDRQVSAVLAFIFKFLLAQELLLPEYFLVAHDLEFLFIVGQESLPTRREV